jgi:transcriptional regulator with XRE-family HTH domain
MSRICRQCGQPLSSYNENDLCGPCVVAARSDPLGPHGIRLTSGLWFRPDVRTALAAWDWRTVLVAVSNETDATQTQLAAVIGLSQAQVSRLMSGASREPGIRTVLSIVDRLGIPRVLAGLAPRGLEALAMPDAMADTVDRVKRREFGRSALGLTLTLPLAGMTKGDGKTDIARLEPDQVVRDLYAMDSRYGGGAIADIARRRLATLKHQLDQASLPPSAEMRAHASVGALGTCAAWLSFDAGDIDRARALDADALYAAHVANNKNLQVEVLVSMILQARHRNRPAEATNLAESALTIARGLDPRIRSLLSMHIAVAAAQQRDAGKFRKQRGQAWRLLEKACDADRPAWLQFFDEHELMGLEALSLMHLGRHAKAAELFGDVVAKQHKFLRNKAGYTAKYATALLHAHKRDEAIAVVYDGLPLFSEVNSARLANDLGRARAALRPHTETNAEAATCHDMLSGLLQSMGAASHV